MLDPSTLRFSALFATSALFGLLLWLRTRDSALGTSPLLGGPRPLRILLAVIAMAAGLYFARFGSDRLFLPLCFAVLLVVEVPKPRPNVLLQGEWREVRRWSTLDLDSDLPGSRSARVRVVIASLSLLALQLFCLLPVVAAPRAVAFALPWLVLAFSPSEHGHARERAKRARALLRSLGRTPRVLARMSGERVLDPEDLRVAFSPERSISGLQRIEVALEHELTPSGRRPRDRIVFRAMEGSHAAAKLRLRFGASASRVEDDPERRAFVVDLGTGDRDGLRAALLRAIDLMEERRTNVESGSSVSTAKSERRLPPEARIDAAA